MLKKKRISPMQNSKNVATSTGDNTSMVNESLGCRKVEQIHQAQGPRLWPHGSMIFTIGLDFVPKEQSGTSESKN